MFRRREARCCFLVTFVVLVLISTFALSTDFLEPHLADLPIPKVNVPHWLKPGNHDAGSYPDVSTDAPSPSSTPSPHLGVADLNANKSATDVSTSSFTLKQTRLAQKPHTPGYTVLDNLYLRNGTFIILTSEEARGEFPSMMDIMGRRAVQDEKRGASGAVEVDQDLQFLDPVTEALGQHVTRIGGVSVVILDSPSKVPNTFYSWWAEVVFGSWRASANATALPGDTAHDTQLSQPIPSRFILPNAEPGSWDDSQNMNGPIMRGGLPNTAVETKDYWQDLRALDSTIVFDRVVLVSREAAMAIQSHGTKSADDTTVASASTEALKLPEASWDTARMHILSNLLGYTPSTPSQLAKDQKPVVAFFSKKATQHQIGSASTNGVSNYALAADVHNNLVAALRELEDEGVCEVQILDVESAGVRAQIELAARSTIIVGPHGEALTNQLWMPQSPLSTVVDLMRPGVSLPEYERLAKTLGHQYWAVWNDTLVNANEAFEGTKDPVTADCDKVPLHVDAQVVVRFIKARLGIQGEDRKDENTAPDVERIEGDDTVELPKPPADARTPPDLEVDLLG